MIAASQILADPVVQEYVARLAWLVRASQDISGPATHRIPCFFSIAVALRGCLQPYQNLHSLVSANPWTLRRKGTLVLSAVEAAYYLAVGLLGPLRKI